MAYDTPKLSQPFRTIVEGFLVQMALKPGAIAVSDPTGNLTYADLEQKSRWIALALVARGVRRTDTVAVCLPRSCHLIAALLGILRASAAYLGIDERHTSERTGNALKACAAKLCILETQADVSQLGSPIETVSLKALEKEGKELDFDLPELRPDDPMYYIFTSGTTGNPKCLRSSHRSVARCTFETSQLLFPSRPITWALATTVAFEAAYRSFMALTTGGTIRTYHASGKAAGLSIIEALREDKVDGMVLTPTQLRILLGREWRTNTLRAIVCIGESLPTRLAHQALQFLGSEVTIYNAYGTAEATLSSTIHRFDPETDAGQTVPVGAAYAGAVIDIVDRNGETVPVGQIGEICIGGDRLTDGYANDPKLTLQKFQRDPTQQNRQRFFTNDLGILDDLGQLTYIGRIENQTTIDGVPFNLSELEAVVSDVDGIATCAAICPAFNQSDIVIFCVGEKIVCETLVYSALQNWIPDLASRIRLRATASLPQTQNGKVDKNALKMIWKSDAPIRLPKIFESAMTLSPTETELATIWSNLLNVQSIAASEDFFELGGDSLMFLQMALSVEIEFDVVLSASMFTVPFTLKNLSEVVDFASRKRKSIQSEETTRRQPHTNDSFGGAWSKIADQMNLSMVTWKGTYFPGRLPILGFNMDGKKTPLFWCFNSATEPNALAEELGADQPVFAFRSMAGLASNRQKRMFIDNAAAEFAQLICRHQPSGALLLGGNCQGAKIMDQVARLLLEQGRQISRLNFLEYVPVEQIDVPVSLFWGRESDQYNPFMKSENPEKEWQRLFPEVTWDIVPGNHGEYFRSKNLPELCNCLVLRNSQIAA